MRNDGAPEDFPRRRRNSRIIIYKPQEPKQKDRILEALIVTTIVALVGALWTVSKNVAVLQTNDTAQDRQIEAQDRRIERLVAELSNRQAQQNDNTNRFQRRR